MMCLWIKKFAILLAMCIGTLGADDLLVTTPSGPIRGTTEEVSIRMIHQEKTIYAFYGIPYAKAPVDDLRFRPPIEVEPWQNELDATKYNPICYHQTFHTDGVAHGDIFSEDCLTVKVNVPKPRPAHATVLVYIHGGPTTAYHPIVPTAFGQIMTAMENLIVVTVNYRVSVHGYLYLGIPEAPGNLGLMDQQMALKWVRRNIASFGGNPDNVVVVGSADVGIQVLLPSSRNLFQRAILDGSTPNAVWAMTTKEDALDSSTKLAKSLGCWSGNPKEVLHCMQSVSQANLSDWKKLIDLQFRPTVDGEFISDYPMNLLKKNEQKYVDVMIGYAYDFTLLHRLLPGIALQPGEKITEKEFLSRVDRFLNKYDNLTRKMIASLYINWTRPEDPSMWRTALEDLLSDYYFHCATSEYTDLYLTTRSTVYRYAVTEFSIAHEDDLTNLYFLSIKIMRWLANFARTGNPNGLGQSGPTWEPTTITGKEYMYFKRDPTMAKHFRTQECSIMKKIIFFFLKGMTRCTFDMII